MTTRFVTGDDGMRYRDIGCFGDECSWGNPTGCEDGSAHMQELPHIPERSADCPWGWPAGIGPAPQYLYDVHAGKLVENPDGTRSMVFPYELREGDVVASLGKKGEWRIVTLSATMAEHCKDLTAWIDWEYIYDEQRRGTPHGAWLLARADPTEDA